MKTESIEISNQDIRVERVARVLYYCVPWEIDGYQPPCTYEGAEELARRILAVADRRPPGAFNWVTEADAKAQYGLCPEDGT